MPGLPWWTVLAGLTEAAKLAREFAQRKRASTASAEHSPAGESVPPPAGGEIQWLNSRLRRLEALRDEDNQITAKLGEQLQSLAGLLHTAHRQLRLSLILSIVSGILSFSVLLWLLMQ